MPLLKSWMNVMFRIRKSDPVRSEPRQEANYRRYKTPLKIDFNACCGYCGIHHLYFGSGSGFHIDHFAPKSKFPDLEVTYSNLIYSCSICNIAKSNDWCGNDSDVRIINGTGYIDPCDADYENNFYRDSAGKIKAVKGSDVAKYMHKKLKFGLKRHEIFWLADYFNEVVSRLGNELQKLDNTHPLYDDINDVLLESIEQMSKYNQLQKGL